MKGHHHHHRSRRIAYGFRRGLLGALLIAFGTLGFGCCALGWLASRGASNLPSSRQERLLGRRVLQTVEREDALSRVKKEALGLGGSASSGRQQKESSRIRRKRDTVLKLQKGSLGPRSRSFDRAHPGRNAKATEETILQGKIEKGSELWAGAGDHLQLRRERNRQSQQGAAAKQSYEEKMEAILWGRYAKLARQRTILAEPRLHDSSSISCGGSGTVDFRTWRELARSIAEFDAKWPAEEPDLRALVAAAQGHVPNLERRPSCAVVGNSGRLLQHEHGREIDGKEVVIRFNWGTTAGYEKHVGSKSHIRIYNGPYVSQKQAGEITIAEIRDPALREWVRRRGKEAAAHAFAFDPEFLCHVWDLVGRSGDKPSTGLVGVILAFKTCSSVDVFGFHYEDYFDPDVQPHYYDWERPKVGREKAHPFEREYALYKQLESAGILTLH